MFSIFRSRHSLYVRNTIFGIEDSLVSTVGLLSGIAVAGTPRPMILLAGVVLIFVEAISMGAGSLLSEHSAEIYEKKKEVPLRRSALGGLVMFVSYFISGFIPLSPYIIFDVSLGFWLSILFALISLFLLGFISAKFFHTNVLRHGLEMIIIGGAAIGVGVVVGKLLSFLQG